MCHASAPVATASGSMTAQIALRLRDGRELFVNNRVVKQQASSLCIRCSEFVDRITVRVLRVRGVVATRAKAAQVLTPITQLDEWL
jgi:hypothetical protein